MDFVDCIPKNNINFRIIFHKNSINLWIMFQKYA